MIHITYVRYVPTLLTETKDGITKNLFESVIHSSEEAELTDAVLNAEKFLQNSFGAVILRHNNVLLKRMCNFKLFQKTFSEMNVIIELQNHIN